MPQDPQQPQRVRNPKTNEVFELRQNKWVSLGVQPPKTAAPQQPAAQAPQTPGHTGIPKVDYELGTSGEDTVKEGKEAIPYAGAMAATAVLPEGAPLWQRLGMAGGGAGIGQGIQDLAEHGLKRQPDDIERAKQEPERMGEAALGKGIIPEAAGAGIAKVLKMAYRASPVPEWIQSYLAKRGINMTGGELAGPGALSTAENVTGAVAINTGITSNFELSRQESYARMLNDRHDEIVQSFQHAPDESITIREGGPRRSVQEVAQETLQRSQSLTQEANRRITDAVAQGHEMTAGEAGDVIIQAVRGTYDQADQAVDDLYQQFKPQITQGGYQVGWSSAAKDARGFLQRAMSAQRMGGTTLPPDMLVALSNVAGRTEHWSGRVDWNPPTSSFQAAWDARKSFGKMIGKLEGQGVITSEQYGALKRMYGDMTEDMLKSLPPQLAQQFRAATTATAAVKDAFNTDLLKSMLRHDQPAVGEKVFATLMQKGNEADLKRLMTIIGGSKDATDSTRRAAVTWLFKNSRNDEAALHLLEDRPGLKQLFGPHYDNLRRELQTRVEASMTPQMRLEQKFLSKLTGIEDPQDVARRMYKSPVYTQHVANLVRNEPLIMQDMAVRNFQELLDASTHNPPYGYQGSQFDPVKFAQNWNRKRDSFRQFLAPEVIRNMDEMSGALSKLTFRPNMGVAAKFKTLAEVSAITSVGATVVLGVLSGHPLAAAETSIAAPIIGVYGPRLFIKATLSPGGSRLLAEGLKVQPGMAAATAWSMRLLEYIGQEALRDDDKGGFLARARQAGASGAHAQPPLRPGESIPVGSLSPQP